GSAIKNAVHPTGLNRPTARLFSSAEPSRHSTLVLLHAGPHPDPPQTAHWVFAASAQIESHCVSQQNGSWPQIRFWHSVLLHPFRRGDCNTTARTRPE
ncbi:MAG: hypothetical protein EA377_12830, partial [Phycisphaerales bacterium]